MTNTVDKDFMISAVLEHNYLPNHTDDHEEMPEWFTSTGFTTQLARSLVASSPKPRKGGYDCVEYRLTRYNGVTRRISIPHPLAYSALALCLYDNWDDLSYITSNPRSRSALFEHEDGRIRVMSYEDQDPKNLVEENLKLEFSAAYRVKADIANFYPSIYSHSIPWAARTIPVAKRIRKDGHWSNALDAVMQAASRGETHGVAIGPGTSDIISEVILAKVDEQLSLHKFEFHRYIDDYTAYCRTEDLAHEFLSCLERELGLYQLQLNILKTEITRLPSTTAPDWVSELTLMMPITGVIKSSQAVSYLDHAVGLAAETPDGSVLKFALKALVREWLRCDEKAKQTLLQYALMLAYHLPGLLPVLRTLLDKPTVVRLKSQIQALALKNARDRRSDGMAWTLYYLRNSGVQLDIECANAIVESRDCIALTLLYTWPSCRSLVFKHANRLLKAQDEHELDRNWLLLHQLYLNNLITTPYRSEGALDLLKNAGLSFFQPGRLLPVRH